MGGTPSDFRPGWTSAPKREKTHRQAVRLQSLGYSDWDPVASVGEDVHQLAASSSAELHHAIGCGEQCVVAAQAHVVARMELGAPLPDQDAAGTNPTAVVDLDP